MVPVPNTKRSRLRRTLKNAACTVRTAVSPSTPFITALMERSEEPCAMAEILIPRRASEFKKAAATPHFSFIPSPTIDTMAQSFNTSTVLMSPVRISYSNSAFKDFSTEAAYSCLTQKLTVYSELDWVISSIEMPVRATAANMRAAIPCLSFMPEPDTLIKAVFLRQLMPRTVPPGARESAPIRVPRADGLWLFKLHASMPRAARGASVLGYSTFEPKNESSIASS